MREVRYRSKGLDSRGCHQVEAERQGRLRSEAAVQEMRCHGSCAWVGGQLRSL